MVPSVVFLICCYTVYLSVRVFNLHENMNWVGGVDGSQVSPDTRRWLRAPHGDASCHLRPPCVAWPRADTQVLVSVPCARPLCPQPRSPTPATCSVGREGSSLAFTVPFTSFVDYIWVIWCFKKMHSIVGREHTRHVRSTRGCDPEADVRGVSAAAAFHPKKTKPPAVATSPASVLLLPPTPG